VYQGGIMGKIVIDKNQHAADEDCVKAVTVSQA
jgi:hypothetical protein